MDDRKVVKTSVRELVEFVLQSGDITSGFSGSTRAVEGTRLHQKLQRSMGEGYTAEVPVSHTVEGEHFDLEISGRIDGIIIRGEDTIIHEIKSTNYDPGIAGTDYNPVHMAQAICYAYIYSLQNGLDEIGIQLTYCEIGTGKARDICEHYPAAHLKNIFDDLAGQYIEWMDMSVMWAENRNSSIKELGFPYSQYRKGQRELAVAVYRSLRDGGKLFVQAPTGIGKTAAVLYPAVKALAEGVVSKVFYLTARTTTGTEAEKTLTVMRDMGLKIKTLVITAKDKICFSPGKECNANECPYAKGYYDRIKTAIKDIFSNQDSFGRETIITYAEKHTICPFEFSLDLSLISDCLICDYNYVFDPKVYLKRFFADGGSNEYCLLIDEAHNLVDRSREMFSASLYKDKVLELKKEAKTEAPGLYKDLKAINDYFITVRKSCEKQKTEQMSIGELPQDLCGMLRSFIGSCDNFLSSSSDSVFRNKLLDFYFEASAFIRISELYDEKYTYYAERQGSSIHVKLFCVDPSTLMAKTLKRGKASVFFSATLSPMDYFIYTLGGDKESVSYRLSSPFPPENLSIALDSSISTKYRVREKTYSKVAEYISALANCRKGNYFAFFPSYKYMYEVYNHFCETNQNIDVICQSAGMSEGEKEDFLGRFYETNDKSLVGFAVMGGVFAEGIDLKGDRLTGAIIVGVGLPQICFERDIIRKHFDDLYSAGFEFAYMYPGMNRVLQAAGRVIRSETDRGVILLIDERFSYPSYEKLYPVWWRPVKIRDIYTLKSVMERFWH